MLSGRPIPLCCCSRQSQSAVRPQRPARETRREAAAEFFPARSLRGAFEALCLGIQTRREDSDLLQALVIFDPVCAADREMIHRLSLQAEDSGVLLYAAELCPNGCMPAERIAELVLSGVDRVFWQLGQSNSGFARQMIVAEQANSLLSSRNAVVLFDAPQALPPMIGDLAQEFGAAVVGFWPYLPNGEVDYAALAATAKNMPPQQGS